MSKSTPTTTESHTDRFERFVALNAGEFWQVTSDTVEQPLIDRGDILLITNIDYVDEQAHTITVRIHPSKQSLVGNRTAKFRVDDFLNQFEFVEPAVAEAERQACLERIQARISDAQVELTQASANPDLLDQFVQRDMPKEQQETHLPIVREAIPSSVVGAIKSQKVTALMSKGLTNHGVEQIKSAMQHQVGVVEQRANWLTKKTSQLSAIAAEMTPYFHEQAAVALAETSEMRKHISKLMKGIGSLDLYTLKDVEVFTIQEGQSAPEDVKLSITQSVLYMDEEAAVFTPIHSGFDCRDRDMFFEALKKYPELVDQIFPSQRCVVGMATTRHYRDYSAHHAMVADKLARENKLVFFLVRDGGNIYGVVSPEAMHQFTPRLFPSWDEMERKFKGVSGEDITYDSIQYTTSLSKFELMSLTYKRILILLCGLDHNRELFGRFYPENASLEFVSELFQSNYLNFIYDDDGTNMLSSKQARSMRDWLKDMNTTITSGSRVLLKWRDCFDPESIPAAFERLSAWHGRDHHQRLLFTPDFASKTGYLEGVVEMIQGNMFVTIALSGENNRYQHRELNGRLSLDVAMQRINDPYSIICLDRVEPDEVKALLAKRSQRKLNVSGIRAIKEAIAVAERDYAEEAPIRAKLYDALVSGGIATGTDALKLISDAVAIFRCANKGKKLNIVNDSKAKYNQLLDQMFMLSGVAGDPTDAVIKAEEKLGRSVIRVTVDAKGVIVAYSTALPAERDDRLLSFPWVAKTRYKTTSKGVKGQKPTFTQLHSRPANETIKYEADDIESYVFPENHPWNTPKAKAKQLEQLTPTQNVLDLIEKIKTDDELFSDMLKRYEVVRLATPGNFVSDPLLTVPLAFAVSHHGRAGTFSLVIDGMEALIFLANGEEVRLQQAQRLYAMRYKDKDAARERFQSGIAKYNGKSLLELGTPKLYTGDVVELWVPNDDFYRIEPVMGQLFSLQAVLEQRFASYVFPAGVTNCDEVLGIVKPTDYRPCVLREIESLGSKDWAGFVLYELTPTLTEAINSDQAHGQKSYFDTIAAACEFISSKHVNYIGDGSSYEKVYYVESEDFPRHWETRDGTQHPAILAWQLER